MNGQHLARTPVEQLEPLVTTHLVKDGRITRALLQERDAQYRAALGALRGRSRTIMDLASQVPIFLQYTIDPAAAAKVWPDATAALAVIDLAREAMQAAPAWEPEAIEQALRSAAEQRGLGVGKVLGPVRMALTGSASSPGISIVLGVLGRDEALKRLDTAHAHVAGSLA
jgi:glutamyl-tRNA synthetase